MNVAKSDKQSKKLKEPDTRPEVIQKTLSFNTKMAFYDIQSEMFFVDFNTTIIPLNALISIILGTKGRFTPLGLSYNPNVGYARQELAFMYEISADSGFDKILMETIQRYKQEH